MLQQKMQTLVRGAMRRGVGPLSAQQKVRLARQQAAKLIVDAAVAASARPAPAQQSQLLEMAAGGRHWRLTLQQQKLQRPQCLQ